MKLIDSIDVRCAEGLERTFVIVSNLTMDTSSTCHSSARSQPASHQFSLAWRRVHGSSLAAVRMSWTCPFWLKTSCRPLPSFPDSGPSKRLDVRLVDRSIDRSLVVRRSLVEILLLLEPRGATFGDILSPACGSAAMQCAGRAGMSVEISRTARAGHADAARHTRHGRNGLMLVVGGIRTRCCDTLS